MWSSNHRLNDIIRRAAIEGWRELAVCRRLDDSDPLINALLHSGPDVKAVLTKNGWNPEHIFDIATPIGVDGARAIGQLLTGLEMLHLDTNTIGDEGALAIAQIGGLATLELPHCWIGERGARAIGQLTQLANLDLSSNHIGDEGALAMAPLRALTTLDLSYNAIGAEGARAIGGLRRLTRLVLEKTALETRGRASWHC